MIYVAEDGGDMQIVLVRETGETFPVVRAPGRDRLRDHRARVRPESGTRLYFSSQRNPGATYEVTGTWGLYSNP